VIRRPGVIEQRQADLGRLQAARRNGGRVNLALLPVEAMFWMGFALRVPWVIGFAPAALVVRA
jgi:hypothetical protein